MDDQESKRIIAHWVESAERDFQTMHNLLKSADYSWSLFLGHLVIEKLIKALHVKKKGSDPLFIHDLLRLLSKLDVEITPEQQKILNTITSFNLNARYVDYKNEFYKKCTKEFTTEWIRIIEETRLWIKELLK